MVVTTQFRESTKFRETEEEDSVEKREVSLFQEMKIIPRILI